MIKGNNVSMLNDVRNKANAITKDMEKMDPNKYKSFEQKIRHYINQSLAEPLNKKPANKAPSVSGSNNKGSEAALSSPFGSSIPAKSNEKS